MDYRLFSALIQELPADCRWTPTGRAKWLHAMTCVVDLMIETVDKEEAGPGLKVPTVRDTAAANQGDLQDSARACSATV